MSRVAVGVEGDDDRLLVEVDTADGQQNEAGEQGQQRTGGEHSRTHGGYSQRRGRHGTFPSSLNTQQTRRSSIFGPWRAFHLSEACLSETIRRQSTQGRPNRDRPGRLK